MVRGTKGTSSMIKEKARASSCGRMVESTMDTGKTESNMVVENS